MATFRAQIYNIWCWLLLSPAIQKTITDVVIVRSRSRQKLVAHFHGWSQYWRFFPFYFFAWYIWFRTRSQNYEASSVVWVIFREDGSKSPRRVFTVDCQPSESSWICWLSNFLWDACRKFACREERVFPLREKKRHTVFLLGARDIIWHGYVNSDPCYIGLNRLRIPVLPSCVLAL